MRVEAEEDSGRSLRGGYGGRSQSRPIEASRSRINLKSQTRTTPKPSHMASSVPSALKEMPVTILESGDSRSATTCPVAASNNRTTFREWVPAKSVPSREQHIIEAKSFPASCGMRRTVDQEPTSRN